MGRMLEALKFSREPKPSPDAEETSPPELPVLAMSCADVAEEDATEEEPAEEEMPFIEVGGPRSRTPEPEKVAEHLSRATAPHSDDSEFRLSIPAPRLASLLTEPPRNVALRDVPVAKPLRSLIAAELVTFHQPVHPVSKQYAGLFGHLFTDTAGDEAPVLVFSALAPGAGTTTSVLNLGIAGAQKGDCRICILDANMHRSASAARLGMNAATGLSDVLSGKAALEQALHATAIQRLSLVPAGTASESEIRSPEVVRWVLKWLRERFDCILVDAPAWEGGKDLQSLVPAANAVYLIVDATEVEKPAVRAVTRDIARWGSRLGGLIVAQ